jgi:hypothetical protein
MAKAKQTRKEYGSTHTTSEIAKDVERGGAEDPQGLAATIRRDAIGQAAMTAHRKKAGKLREKNKLKSWAKSGCS